MITVVQPAALALSTFCSKVQVPRWINAIEWSSGGAGKFAA
jgi:hypothetical protein